MSLLCRLGLRRRRHRGVRAGRKSCRPISVVVTTRRGDRQGTELKDGRRERRVLSQPPRLTLRQTSQAGRSMSKAPPLSSKMRVGHLNVRSLTKHIDDVNHLLLAEELDLLGLSESWLVESMDNSSLVFPGYSVTRRDRTGRSGGGVAILCHNSLSVEPMTVPSAGSPLESLWIQLTGRRQIIVGVVYRPPSGPVAPVIDDLHDQLTFVISKRKPVFILGDTNFDITQPSKAGVKEYSRLLSDLSLHQLITSPTRPGPNPSLLDHLITNRSDLTSDPRVVASNFSDHDLIIAIVAGVRTRQQPRTVTVRSTRQLSQDALCLDLLMADWTPVYRAVSTENKWEAWRSAWDPQIDRHMPLRRIKVKHQPQPWLHDESVTAAREARDTARRDKKLTPCDETEHEFRARRNDVKVAQHRACSNYFLTSYRHSKSTTWKDIRRFLISSSKPQTAAHSPTSQQPGWLDRLNRHFADVGPAVAAELAAADTGETLRPRPPRVVSGAFSPRPATLPELSAALKRMSPSRATGDDGITIDMLRMTFPVVGPHLLHVINSSITRAELPPSWRAATVVPLYKGGDKCDPNNYRPISLLSVVAKLCERVVCSQLMAYLTKHAILCPQQYGFRPGQSTEAALLDAVSFVTDNIDRSRVSALVTADTSKAFDSVEHGRLLEKLGWYGVDDRWFRAWLSGRTQSGAELVLRCLFHTGWCRDQS